MVRAWTRRSFPSMPMVRFGRPPFWTTRTSGSFAFACVQPMPMAVVSKKPLGWQYAMISRMITTASSPSDPIREIVWVLTRKMFPCWSLRLVRVLRRWLLAQIAEVCFLRVMVRSGVPVPTWVVKTRTEIWAPSTRCRTCHFLFNRWVSLGNYALWTRRTDRFGPSVLVITAEFGNGNANQFTFNDPQQLLSTGVSAVAAGVYHSLIVKADGSFGAAGQNGRGQLG